MRGIARSFKPTSRFRRFQTFFFVHSTPCFRGHKGDAPRLHPQDLVSIIGAVRAVKNVSRRGRPGRFEVCVCGRPLQIPKTFGGLIWAVFLDSSLVQDMERLICTSWFLWFGDLRSFASALLSRFGGCGWRMVPSRLNWLLWVSSSFI